MRFKIVEQQPRTYAIILSTGEELASGLKWFVSDRKLGGGSFKAIAHGGHLMEACVRPTCEVVLTESPEKLHKSVDPESGLALITL